MQWLKQFIKLPIKNWINDEVITYGCSEYTDTWICGPSNSDLNCSIPVNSLRRLISIDLSHIVGRLTEKQMNILILYLTILLISKISVWLENITGLLNSRFRTNNISFRLGQYFRFNIFVDSWILFLFNRICFRHRIWFKTIAWKPLHRREYKNEHPSAHQIEKTISWYYPTFYGGKRVKCHFVNYYYKWSLSKNISILDSQIVFQTHTVASFLLIWFLPFYLSAPYRYKWMR